ncbi:hypothetical protein HX13_11670 [Chryseobacterium sp. P1-3]|uniref:Glycosyltransferase family 39 protein n=1 Tax=Chryseobacterium gallinarum TaxID=1324352 RepID=A0A0G3M641_CHRGL|nr:MULTISPECIES: hypothetical protein [Chryseobacterium]AKK74075.1 hypothetical protein OK18_16975 [Chryseobacterium gallinarum]KFF74697.1 hypothetical protein HX13_11670 [Chryseobacterium sp. P1-3]MCL8537889.1 hypothetical protein [Chryseobacterium gallinarum]
MNKRETILIFIFSIYVCCMSYFLYTHQYYNVDMEAYMGLIYKAEYPDMKIEEIHQKVYKELEGKNPNIFGDIPFVPEEEEVAKGENSYYRTLSQNPKAYEEELQLFVVKPFYNFINWAFFKIGFKASTSTFLISIVSYALILILIVCFLIKILKNYTLAIIITFLFSLFKPLLEASRHASADSLSCLLLLLSLYAFTVKKNLFSATIWGMLCVLTRPEYFIFYSFLYALIFIYRKCLQVKTTTWLISYSYILLSFFLIQYFNQVSWSTLFMNQFTKVQLYPVSQPDPFDFSAYIHFIKSKILFEFNSSYFPLLLLFIIIVLANDFSIRNKKNQVQALFFAAIYGAVFLRFLIFPLLVNRMMIGFYLLIILSVIYIQNSKVDIFKKSLQHGK